MGLKLPSLKLVAIFALAISFLVYPTESFYSDPGIGWHIAIGKYIFENFSLPSTDIFLGIKTYEKWVIEQYLADFINYSVLHFFGWHGAKLFIFLILLSFYWYYLYGYLQKIYGNLIPVLTIFCAFQAMGFHYVFRPIYFSFLCFGFIYQRVIKIIKDDYKVGIYDYGFLIFFFSLWSNLHPSFLLGIVFLLCILCANLINATEKFNFNFWVTIKLLLASLVGIIINPYGFEVLFQVITFGSSNFTVYLYQEWASLNIHHSITKIILFLALFISIVNIKTAKKIRLEYAITLIVFLFLCLSHVRILPYLGIVAIYPLAESFYNFVKYLSKSKTKLGKYLFRLTFRLERISRSGFNLDFKWYLILFPVSFYLLNYSTPIFVPEKDLTYFPWKGLEFLKRNNINLVLNNLNLGSWLDYFGEGKVKGVIDDRTSLLREDYYKLYDSMMVPEGNWRSYAKSLNVNHLFIKSDDRLAIFLLKNDKNNVIYQDDLIIVYKIL